VGQYQRGYVCEQSSAFHVRYYTTELINDQPKPAQKSERHHLKDDKHPSVKCTPVQQPAGVMERIYYSDESHGTFRENYPRRKLIVIEAIGLAKPITHQLDAYRAVTFSIAARS
jgi:hypothetical protein